MAKSEVQSNQRECSRKKAILTTGNKELVPPLPASEDVTLGIIQGQAEPLDNAFDDDCVIHNDVTIHCVSHFPNSIQMSTYYLISC